VGTAIQKGIIFDIKKYAIDDGPGIRTTVFFKGCPLQCWWCHNPEGQVSTPELMYKSRRCIECGECAENCPAKAIVFTAKHVSINRELCDLCGICTRKCPTEAFTLVGKEVSVEGLVREIETDNLFYEVSGGGMTVSGGEPLMQPDFLNALLRKCKERNIRTAVDTCGYAPYEVFEKIRDKVDLFLYDIKTMDERKHMKYAGVSNKPILENFKRLSADGSCVVVRLAVIPGINDSEDNIMETAQFIVSNRIKHVSLLPYHRAGIEKYKSLNKPYRLKRIQTPSDERINSIKQRLESFRLTVTIGGG